MEEKTNHTQPGPAATPIVQPASAVGEHIMQFFEFGADDVAVAGPFSALAHALVATLPRNPERTVALRKLLEAKEAAVRAARAQ